MSDDSVPKPNFGLMQWRETTISLQPNPLPIVYFDGVPTFSHLNGIIGITLTATAHIPNGDGGADMCASTVAFLKCNIPAANNLISALQGALLLASPVDNPQGKAN
ncbi:hypothetical protein [uncultured Bradyrhizobium sp.]|uniref:hypothetical protein n=1 Tax=uncultured Bradyrhizobium sp. TaxID=199684 RepID=UPI00261D352E|nr:hypothetical protein [uncultured Bradyrhizobium sp.]